MNSYNRVSDSVYTFLCEHFWLDECWFGFNCNYCMVYLFHQKPQILAYLTQSPILLMALFIFQLVLVFCFLCPCFMLFSMALSIFLLYAMLNGVIFSGIFFTSTQESIALTFGIAAANIFCNGSFWIHYTC